VAAVAALLVLSVAPAMAGGSVANPAVADRADPGFPVGGVDEPTYLRRALAALAAAPADEQDELQQRIQALGSARGEVAGAARAAEARGHAIARVLVAMAARAGREARNLGMAPIRAQRFRGALAALLPTWRAATTAAVSRRAVADRLRGLEAATVHQAQRTAAAGERAGERRLELALGLARAELSRASALRRAARRLALARERELDVVFTEAQAAAPTGPLGPSAAGDPAALVPPARLLAGVPPGATSVLAGWSLRAPEPGTGQGAGDSGGLGAGRRAEIPIAGEVARQFGEAAQAPLDRGITILSPRTQPVRVPRSGVVAFAGPFKSFGLLLIVDHGHEYHSLLAGMSRLDVRQGDVVVAGQAVGAIAGSGSEPAGLYLELRHAGRPVNPLPWLAAREHRVRG
jgi:murein DD-endopeptidase MepM/ murein hydrolase activator NlpD